MGDETLDTDLPTVASETVMSSDRNSAPQSASATVSAKPELKIQKEGKIDVYLKPVGDAPILKNQKFAIDRTKTIGYVAKSIRLLIKMPVSESLFIYVSQSFAPSLDQTIENLYNCFGADNRLLLHYSKSQAWG